jgi:ubiquinone biosynthesis protein UbiJ
MRRAPPTPTSAAASCSCWRSRAHPRRRSCKAARSQIRGDADVARKYRELARLLMPDPEEELSLVIGDVPAHQLGRLARKACQAGVGASGGNRGAERRRISRARARRPRAARRSGSVRSGVERTREDVDRLEARINLLAP